MAINDKSTDCCKDVCSITVRTIVEMALHGFCIVFACRVIRQLCRWYFGRGKYWKGDLGPMYVVYELIVCTSIISHAPLCLPEATEDGQLNQAERDSLVA